MVMAIRLSVIVVLAILALVKTFVADVDEALLAPVGALLGTLGVGHTRARQNCLPRDLHDLQELGCLGGIWRARYCRIP